jgi:hypothetical protein
MKAFIVSVSVSVVAIAAFATEAQATTFLAAAGVRRNELNGSVLLTAQFNSAGGANSVWMNPGVGSYTVSFGSMWLPTLPRTVQVSAVQGVCSTTSEGAVDNDLLVTVQC